MPRYDYPGVYVEEMQPLARPIAGVSTSTAGFIGVATDSTPMPEKPDGSKPDFEGFDVNIVPADDKLPTSGTAGKGSASLQIDAADKLHFRIFNASGNQILDESKVPGTKASNYDALKTQLKGKTTLADSDKAAIIKALTSIFTPPPYTIATANEPKLVTSWDSFLRQFGKISDCNKHLAHAVYSFFNNGGSRCYVSRIATYTGATDLDASLKKFGGIDEISIVAAPVFQTGATQDNLKEVHTKLIDHCSAQQDRVAILDLLENTDPTTLTKGQLAADPEGFSALYCPWIEVSDPANPGQRVNIPPSGAVAGIYARTDGERGVHKAPANEIVRGALGLTHQLGNNEQGPLNDIGVNLIRNFYGSIMVWGGRTLAAGTKPEWQYVNVRRYMNFLRESIAQNLRWAVFEPNEYGLWQRVSRTVSDFLLAQWRAGALFGESPKQAFFVRCDASTNTPDQIAVGQLVCEIGVAIVKPAEFVIFRIQQQAGG